MPFQRIALNAGGMARAQRIRYAKALARRIVALVINLDAKACLPEMYDPVFTAAAMRVFPDLYRHRSLRGHDRCSQQRQS